MDNQTWMTFIDHFWSTIAYGQMVKLYRDNGDNLPNTAFFEFTYHALRNQFFMSVAHTVHLCDEIDKSFDIGPSAKATLSTIKALYKKGDSADRTQLDFQNCGLGPFRDKLLAHPLNKIKAVLRKTRYDISITWETVDETVKQIKKFCDEVESHYLHEWRSTTYKEDIEGIDVGFQHLIWVLDSAQKYDELKREVAKRGRPRIHCDWQHDELVLDAPDRGN